MRPTTRMIVFDDDPTGTQTVHGCLLLTQWNREAVAEAFADTCPFFYILTNTRAHPAETARRLVTEAMRTVLAVNREVGDALLLVSRSDSTLRSHFPVEIDAITAALREAGERPPEAIFVVPAFIEAGRLTAGDEHFVIDGGRRLRADETEFARDAVFGYATSHLPSYIAAKTGGAVAAGQVRSVPLAMLRDADPGPLQSMLAALDGGVYVVVNAETYDDLNVFARAVHRALADGKRFAFHSAASVVKALSGISDKPLVGGELVDRPGPGLVVVGSHVAKTTRQLNALLAEPSVEPIEVDVGAVLSGDPSILQAAIARVDAAAAAERTPAVCTSRREYRPATPAARLEAGRAISRFLVDLVRGAGYLPAWVLAKGGITSHDVLAEGLGVATARVAGQILPGVPVVKTPADSRFGAIPCIIFPGNVGDDDAVRRAYEILSDRGAHE